jgi:hypothetical protein
VGARARRGFALGHVELGGNLFGERGATAPKPKPKPKLARARRPETIERVLLLLHEEGGNGLGGVVIL